MADVVNPENEGDLQAQIEEVEALSSIYGEEWCVIDEASRIFCIKISDDLEEPKLTACLQIILPHDYPSAAPPIYQINAAWLRGAERTKLANSLEDLYVEHVGESILYLWVEKVREFLVDKSQSSETVDQPEKVNMTAEEEVDDPEDIADVKTLQLNTEPAHLFMDHANDEELPPIKHGNAITDRRSTFQPHLAPVVTPRQVKMVLGKLYENKKIASATHNIYAYRIYCEDKHSFLLLHLLQILDVSNVMVVVSRWYGGILLGPDRFKHINNCARNILVEQGYTAAMVRHSLGLFKKRRKRKKTK
uniref:Impact RWD domain protein n=1 Tax=Sander lucioperca TaxID=283035 RepID=A0A8C9YAF8_SANLU